jgi:hypothetical protein
MKHGTFRLGRQQERMSARRYGDDSIGWRHRQVALPFATDCANKSSQTNRAGRSSAIRPSLFAQVRLVPAPETSSSSSAPSLTPIVCDPVVVKRGDKAVHCADAKIEKRERIVLIVNHEASTKTPAIVIRSTAA